MVIILFILLWSFLMSNLLWIFGKIVNESKLREICIASNSSVVLIWFLGLVDNVVYVTDEILIFDFLILEMLVYTILYLFYLKSVSYHLIFEISTHILFPRLLIRLNLKLVIPKRDLGTFSIQIVFVSDWNFILLQFIEMLSELKSHRNIISSLHKGSLLINLI